MRIQELSIYPVKSLQGISLERSTLEKRGLTNDRRFMIVDKNGTFLTQRNHRNLASFRTELSGDLLKIVAPDRTELNISLNSTHSETTIDVVVWTSEVEAIPVSEEANSWISAKLGFEAKIVFMPESFARPVNSVFNTGSDIVSFADGYPVLIVNTASLESLNKRLASDVPIERFRPNIVIEGGQPWAEDSWQRIRIGSVVLRAAKPCARCVVTTIDQQTGKLTGKDPLRELSRFRRADQVFPADYNKLDLTANSVLFGVNYVPESYGEEIRTGDTVKIID